VARSTFSRIGASDVSREFHTMFGMSCENFEADGVMEGLKAVDGVTSARMRIMKELTPFSLADLRFRRSD
jgi:hypothetical protein